MDNLTALSNIIISMAPPKKRKRDEGQKGISRFFLNTVPNESTGGEEGRVTGVEEQVRGAEGGDHYLLPTLVSVESLSTCDG